MSLLAFCLLERSERDGRPKDAGGCQDPEKTGQNYEQERGW